METTLQHLDFCMLKAIQKGYYGDVIILAKRAYALEELE